ncbi:nitrate- and nitrite sensing domain-containing protein [Streptomyces sp. ISL-112]|uniref:sensor histidine kinase n=1 Tax=unclassified Streptomyces TaxID=2593676 RepID=UPI001BE65FA2|nr:MULTISPECIES: nitrate- and nitrite sensing domain-containing protein [unclassified Streptomyces]MBT2430150.1 nitrate- and nitrite sensing domain-containing protein [Streptomyces sp. ISL-112]MBT2465884.1 nitrate- and nitrite sensing domain-containing protein [Streptomyces sp. ISL-63]
MRFRGKSIRRKIVALLLVPLVSLTGLWVLATYVTGRQASELMSVSTTVDKVAGPLEEAVRVVQAERRQTLVFLADPRASDALPLLLSQRADTDRIVAEVRDSARQNDVREALDAEARTRLDAILSAVDGLDSLRESVEKRTIGRTKALDFYNGLVDPAYRFLNGLHTTENGSLDKQMRALVGISRAREMLSREDALVASSLIAGRFTTAELRQVSGLVAQRDLLYEVSLENLPAAERRRVEQFWSSPDAEPLRTAEDTLIAAGPTKRLGAVDTERWQEAAPPVLDRLADDSTEMGNRFQDRAEPAGYRVLAQAGIAGVLGFLALIISIFVSVRIGRELVRDLSRLRKEAHEVSGVRLPSVMRRLASGEQVDVETEAPHLTYERDEIGQVGQALNTLQRAAVEAAVKQADMRRGVSEVFVNLARRNQVLLHRQLTLLDAMERRTENSDELADLFRLDHLTTRMRRHAEGLVILSGAAPSRQWRKPIQLMDVVRAAVAEVEDYERIEVRRLPRIGVGGPAVADLTHLIAELLENATVFSPPHTAVQVHGERVSNGFTLEIHDRGLGMPPAVLLDANLRLAETPDFELSDTDRLGLFVVSRLAQRQNVRVSLQKSPYGGTTAVVFIPAALLTEAPETHGTGFRLDRRAERAIGSGRTDGEAPSADGTTSGGDRRANGRSAVLSPVPTGLTGPAVLDGPVELEAPVGPLDLTGDRLDRASDPALDPALGPVLDGVCDLEDTESERGGIFRARDLRRDDGRDPRREDDRGPRGDDGRDRRRATGREQHQQARDHGEGPTAEVRPMRPAGPVPLPRRTPPTLVTDRGRRVDDQGPDRDLDRDGAEPPATAPRTPTGPVAHTTPWAARAAQRTPAPFSAAEPPRTTEPPHTPEPPRTTEARPESSPASSAPDTVGGLPRRVRQASLAHQLRAESADRTPHRAPVDTVDDYDRDADEVRNRMASLQRGWQRGRRQNAEDTHDATGPEGTAPGTTPGGDGR